MKSPTPILKHFISYFVLKQNVEKEENRNPTREKKRRVCWTEETENHPHSVAYTGQVVSRRQMLISHVICVCRNQSP